MLKTSRVLLESKVLKPVASPAPQAAAKVSPTSTATAPSRLQGASSFNQVRNPAPPVRPATPAYPNAEGIQRIISIPDPVARNYAITQGYYEVSRAFASVVGNQDANWTTYAVWASRQAGKSIRKEDVPKTLVSVLDRAGDVGEAIDKVKRALGPFGKLFPPVGALLGSGDEALDEVSANVGEGNRKVFEEISQAFVRFIETFPGDAPPDARTRQAFIRSFRPDQTGLRDGMLAYLEAKFETDPAKKSELMARGNTLVGLHEQTFLQVDIDKAMNAPVENMVRDNLKALLTRGLLGRAFERSGLLDKALDPLVHLIEKGVRRYTTERMMELAMPDRTMSLGNDLVGPGGTREFPEALKTIEDPKLRELLAKLDRSPNSLTGTGASDWSKLGDRMNYIVDLMRVYQQDDAMFGPPFPTMPR